MAVSFGSELRRRRLAAAMSLADLARAVHYSKGYLSKIETGVKVAGPDLARRCDAVLKADGALLALTRERTPVLGPAGNEAVDTRDRWETCWLVRVGPEGQGELAGMLRRGVLLAGALGVFGWKAPPGFVRRRDGSRHYDAFRSMFDLVRAIAQNTSPAALMPVLIAHTETLRHLAATTSDPASGRLWLLAARYAEFTGWMAQESGNDTHALLWTEQSVELADTGGDRRLGAYAFVRQAEIAMYQGRPRDTIVLAQHAQTLDCGSHIRGLAAQREGQGHALAGDARRCHLALDRAAQWLAEPDHEGSLPRLGTSNVSDLIDLVVGWALVDLGEPGRAVDLLHAQLEQTPVTAHRMKARIGARYALALVGAGEVEHSCAAVPRLLEWCADVDSATVRTDLRRLLRALNRWPRVSCVRGVMPELTAAVSPQ
jgi:transcriptional regulator with XRE-family HTH domain